MKNKKPLILAIIPARGGSKSIPRKNIKNLAGKPLIVYTIETALKSDFLDRVIVSTDDEEIAEVARKYGAEVVVRPKKLAEDETPTLPVLQHVVKYLEEKENYKVDVVVVLQPTSPLREVSDIDNSIKKVLDTNADSVETFCQVNYLPSCMFKIIGDKAIPLDRKSLEKYKGRQDFPELYKENGAVFVVRRNVLMRKNTVYGVDHRAVIMPKERSIDIDDIIDFKLAELIINEKNKNWR